MAFHGGYVFPVKFKEILLSNQQGEPEELNFPGMTRRDWLAGLAMQSILGNYQYVYELRKKIETKTKNIENVDAILQKLISKLSYNYADKLIAQSINDI
jgi:hypothetical protein